MIIMLKNLLTNMQNERPRNFYKNTLIYYDENGREYINPVGPKDIIISPVGGYPLKKYLRIPI